MPLLQVRECPEDLYKKITLYARLQNRSIAQQVLVLVEKGLGQEMPNIERRKILLNKITNRTIPQQANLIDDVAEIREDRNR